MRVQNALERLAQLTRVVPPPGEHFAQTKTTSPPSVVRLVMRVGPDDHWLPGGNRFRQRTYSALVNHCATAPEQEVVRCPWDSNDLVIVAGHVTVRADHQDGPNSKSVRGFGAHLIKAPWLIDRKRPEREDNGRSSSCQKVGELGIKRPRRITQKWIPSNPRRRGPVALRFAQHTWKDAQRQQR
jgi:hypothetical protein